ncbi:hypothetical protein BGX21_011524 [Mortierella sp. AD011]|nr:hypothetical protein BGX20_002385 [Mortierella sp. AD010]KAF9390217.1 hypothetical protein BGX21_011524 [Mortierella sp. AD011]
MDHQLTITCLIDGDPIKDRFPILVSPTDSISDLKKLIKAEKASSFGNIDAGDITLWKVLFRVSDFTKDLPAFELDDFPSKLKVLLNETISDIFPDGLPQEYIHIIAEKPKSGRDSKYLVYRHQSLSQNEESSASSDVQNRDASEAEHENGMMYFHVDVENRLIAFALLSILGGRLLPLGRESTPYSDDEDDSERWEQIVSTYKAQSNRDNLVRKIVLWEDKMRKSGNEHDRERLHDTKEVLRIFTFHQRLFDEDFVPKDGMGLFQASLASFMPVQGAHSVNNMPVLNERFVAAAVRNYFTELEPKFVAKIQKWEEFLKSPDGRGRDWKELIPAAIVEGLAKWPLSSWSHNLELTSVCQDLIGPSEIIGLKGQETCESITHESISLSEFLKAHFVDNSLKDGKPVPPFYFPEGQASGHDIIFCIGVSGKAFPVFLQLKLRTVVSDKSNDDDRTRRLKATELGGLCPAGTYVSLIIDYPTAVTAKLHRRPDPLPQFYNLQGVTIRVDDGNFREIFPKDHVALFDMLKTSLKKTGQNDE